MEWGRGVVLGGIPHISLLFSNSLVTFPTGPGPLALYNGVIMAFYTFVVVWAAGWLVVIGVYSTLADEESWWWRLWIYTLMLWMWPYAIGQLLGDIHYRLDLLLQDKEYSDHAEDDTST
jgi:hypothetical protein